MAILFLKNSSQWDDRVYYGHVFILICSTIKRSQKVISHITLHPVPLQYCWKDIKWWESEERNCQVKKKKGINHIQYARRCFNLSDTAYRRLGATGPVYSRAEGETFVSRRLEPRPSSPSLGMVQRSSPAACPGASLGAPPESQPLKPGAKKRSWGQQLLGKGEEENGRWERQTGEKHGGKGREPPRF